MGEDPTWLETWVEQSDDSDFNDSDEVQGWLSATLIPDPSGGFMLTVTFQPDSNNDEAVEKYRVTRIKP